MTCINPLQAFLHGFNQCCGVEKPTQQEIEDRGFKLTAHRAALGFTDLMYHLEQCILVLTAELTTLAGVIALSNSIEAEQKVE
jgi:hypothetical protein